MAVFAGHIILGVKASLRVLIDEMPDGVEKAMAEELLHVHEESRCRAEGLFRIGEDVKCEREHEGKQNERMRAIAAAAAAAAVATAAAGAAAVVAVAAVATGW